MGDILCSCVVILAGLLLGATSRRQVLVFVDIDPQYNEISVRNLIDHSIIESFGAEGKTCITSRTYPKFVNNDDAHLYAFNYGTQSVKISQMSAWSMKSAEFVIDQTAKSSA